ncbi:MAG: DUF2970 domain-containing protein [Methylococcaceae bacterium]|nr:DUF2970 domain-containing protein [Methylococcaceae bacterium]
MSKPTITQVIQSVLAAFIGVQSEANRKHAFENGSLLTYVVAGLIFTLLFIGVIVLLVSAVL